jgi:spore coat protein U-like protein
MFKKLTIALAVAGTVGAFAGNAAAAGSAPANLTVQASVASSCTIATSALNFGAYDPIGANASADKAGSGTVTVTCTKNAPAVTISMGLGSHAAASVRNMLGATNGDSLQYELYHPSAATPTAACGTPPTTVWGTAAGALFSPSTTWGAGAPKVFNVCGLIPQAQNVSSTSAGESYQDTVVATVNF